MRMLRNRIYYRIKPFVPQSVRTTIRRKYALYQRTRTADVWPIIPGSERRPISWPGWPGGKQFALVLTHDVETAVGLQRCSQLMALEQEVGFRSSYNFVPEGEYTVSKELRDALRSQGFEVGVHDLKHDGLLYKSRHEFSNRAKRINHYLREWHAEGFRSAFMLNQLDWLHDLDICYDASTFDTDPFEPQPQGQETIFPFWVNRPPLRKSEVTGFGVRSTCEMSYPESVRSSTGYVELPYTLPQDSTLFVLLQEKTPEMWMQKLEWLAQNGGMALVITHPDYMSFNGSRSGSEYPVTLYRQFLERVREQYAGAYWHALPKEVASYTRRVTVGRGNSAASSNGGAVATLDSGEPAKLANRWRLRGKRGAVVLFSYYPSDSRPRRAAQALRQEGVSIDFICLRRDKTESAREVDNGINIIRIPIKRERGGKWSYIRQYALFILGAFGHLSARSLKRRYDFIHVHNMPDVLVFSAIVPKLQGARILLDLHDPVPELMETIFDLPSDSAAVRSLRKLEKWSIRFADHVITVNKACKQIYTARSCPADKITVVVNSPEETVFGFRPPSRNGHDRKDFSILYHGSLLPRNGFDIAIDALAKIRRSIPEARLVVCAERTPFFAQTMDAAAKRSLADRIEYLGVKNRADMAAIIKNCDVGIIPNRRSVFADLNTPTRIFECLALGKPVIAPRTRGICDYFAESDLVFFEVGNADDLARQLEFVYSDPAEAEKIVHRGQRVYQNNSWSHQHANLIHAVSGLL
jgi:glycosyltransferase involved in cell wall biosynthesis